VRESHAVLENTVQDWNAPPEVAPGRYEHPGGDYLCLTGSTRVRFLPGVLKAYRARYGGDATEVVTSSGEVMTVTPNHPCLTARGWVSAKDLQIGDKLFSASYDGFNIPGPHQDNGVTMEQVFDFLSEFGTTKTVTLPHSQLYGDISPGEEIDVIDVDRSLMLDRYPSLRQPFNNLGFTLADAPRLGPGESPSMGEGLRGPLGRFMGLSDSLLSLIFAHSLPSEEHCISSAPCPDSSIPQSPGNRNSRHTDSFRDGLDAHSLIEELDHLPVDIVSLIPWSQPYPTHVYSFETMLGVYTTAGIVANCRCVAIPIIPGDEEVGG